MNATRNRSGAAIGCLFYLVLQSSGLHAELPLARLDEVFPPGAQRGTQVEVSVRGGDLDEADALWFSNRGIRAEAVFEAPQKDDELLAVGPRRVAGRFRVHVDGDVPTGVYEVRTVGRFGVSNSRAFFVGTAPVAIEKEPDAAHDAAQVIGVDQTVYGRIDKATDRDAFRFSLSRGARVRVEIAASLLDSPLDSVLRIHDAGGRELPLEVRRGPWGRSVDVASTEDAEFTVTVTDRAFSGGPGWVYRLRIGNAPRIEWTLPLAVPVGAVSEVEVFGAALPGGKPVDKLYRSTGAQPGIVSSRVNVRGPWPDGAGGLVDGWLPSSRCSQVDIFPLRLSASRPESDPFPMGLATEPVLVESEPNDALPATQDVSAPFDLSATFWPPGDRDGYSFHSEKNQTWIVEVISERQGFETDAAFAIERLSEDGESAKEVAFQDDGASNLLGEHFLLSSSDPVLKWKSGEAGRYRIVVHDLQGEGRETPGAYRLIVRKPRPDFRLVAVPAYSRADPDEKKNTPRIGTLFVRRGGTTRLRVAILRRDGFASPVDVSVDGLPQGIRCAPQTLDGSRSICELVIEADEDCSGFVGPLRVLGEARTGGVLLRRVARAGTTVRNARQNQESAWSRVAERLVLCASAEELAPLTLKLGDPKGRELELWRGAVVKLPVEILARTAKLHKGIDLTAEGLVKGLDLPKLTSDPKKSRAEVQLTVKKDAVPGSSTLWLRGRTELDYARRPELVTSAESRVALLDASRAQLEEKGSQLETTLVEQRAALEKLAADRAASSAAEETARLETESQRATEAIAALEAEQQEVARQRELVAKTQEAARKRVEETKKAAAPKKTRVEATSTALRVRILPTPFVVEGNNAAVEIRPGESRKLPVSLRRLTGFSAAVQVRPLETESKILSAQPVDIAGDQSTAELTLHCAEEAAVGPFELRLSLSAKAGGIEQKLEQVLRGRILPPIEAAAKDAASGDSLERE